MISYLSIPTELLELAHEKDRRYFTFEKGKSGMHSYREALDDICFYFQKIKMGAARIGSQTPSGWARAWGWDFRKALRFIMIILDRLFELDKKFLKLKELKERIAAVAKRQATKMKSYVRKTRGQSLDTFEPDENEDERLFLDAMAAIAKSNQSSYRATIKTNLRNGHKITFDNFQNFLKTKKSKKNDEISDDEILNILKSKLIVNYKVESYCKLENGDYMITFIGGFSTRMTKTAIIENAA